MACSTAMSKRKQNREDCAAQLPPEGGGRARRRRRRPVVPPLRLRPELDRQPLGRDRRRTLRAGILARMIKFPAGKKAGGALTLLVDGAHAPLIQHLTPMIVERVNRFFGYAAINRIVFRQGRPPAAAPKPRTARSSSGAQGTRRRPARNRRSRAAPLSGVACARKLPLAAAPPSLPQSATTRSP